MTLNTTNNAATIGDTSPFACCGITEAGRFIADYTAWLWGCGATCLRIERNTERIARALGFDLSVTIMPRHIQLTLCDKVTGRQEGFHRLMVDCGINFDLNSRLSSLSWKIADRRVDFYQARQIFNKIISQPYPVTATTVMLASLANASFCRLFGGDAVAMGVVFFATMVGLVLKLLLLRMKVDVRIVIMLCAFVSSVICIGSHVFSWGATPGIAVATSVLYLVPGVPFINSASDLIERHYLCALSRFMDACVLTACLSIGLCAALSVMGISHI